MGGGSRSVWVGLSDREKEGTFVWVDGSDLQDSDMNTGNKKGWGRGQPRNYCCSSISGEDTDCVYSRSYPENYGYSPYKNQSFFITTYCSSTYFQTVCSVPNKRILKQGVCHDTNREAGSTPKQECFWSTEG